jgi:fused signal recognition particle receptor
MFGKLKEKLKDWINKNQEKEEIVKLERKDKEKIKKKESKEEIKKDRSAFSKFSKKIDDKTFEEMFEELEMILLQSNVAYEVVEEIKKSLKEKILGKYKKEIDLTKELKESIKNILMDPPEISKEIKKSLKEKGPFVIMFSGINGSGKTTTIAKVAHYLKNKKFSVCLAAADTFRAAAIQQLEEHANKLGVPIIKKDYGADPASVGFDAINYAKKNKIDIVLIDTAGRMQNRDSLMREIEKISRVNNPDMKIFLGESITGNDATEQAKAFNKAINLTGIILSKADVDEKGGTAISVSQATGKPILFIGTGQNYGDLEVFNKEKIIKKLGL